MFTFASADWVQQRLESPDVLVIDPRSPVRYMAGHPKNAVNLPVSKSRDAQGALLPPEELARWVGAAGLDDERTPVVYDNSDGRDAAMLAWVLLYLGRRDVHLLNIVWEKWVAEDREVFYRPVKPVPRTFHAQVRPEVRAMLNELGVPGNGRAIDFRSHDEFTGKLDTEGRPGHIPGAINIVWQEVVGENGQLLAARERLDEIFSACGIEPGERVIAYCRSGARAALGFLALAEAGRSVSLYDGSYAEWVRSGMPVETVESKQSGGAHGNG
jgi:thiosulfate/3-mercaptopyruvate sulfurtransferase